MTRKKTQRQNLYKNYAFSYTDCMKWRTILFYLLNTCIFILIPFVVHAEEIVTIAIQRPQNPVMRVLVGNALNPTIITARAPFVVETAEQVLLLSVPAEQQVKIAYTKKDLYTITSGDQKIISNVPVRVTPLFLDDIVEIVNLENRPAWNTKLNDNLFYGSLEVVYSTVSDATLLVNEIPIERYVRGIAEVTDDQPTEYLKTLLTAARTYALWNIQHPTKHKGEPYILSATDNDQIYRGAGFSLRAPHAVAAQKATKKRVILYDGEPIIAPYFSNSDGRTRAWSEVWSGDYPWAQSVLDPCCVDKTLYGHGVGLSGEGARYFAKQGWLWRDILKYYYSGVEIVRGY